MKIKRWLSLPIIAGGLLAYIPYNYYTHHNQNTKPIPAKKYTMSYAKYLEAMNARNSLASADPIALSSNQSEPALLGRGYDLTNGTFSNKSAFNNPNDIGVSVIPLESDYSFESINSQSQLTTDLGVSASARFGFKHFALSGSASFHQQVTTDTSSIHIAFRMKTDVIELFDTNNNAQLSNKAKSLINAKDNATFFNYYDAKYVSKLYATREVLFNLDIKLNKTQSKTKISAKLNFKKGLLSLSGAFDYAFGENSATEQITMNTMALPGGEVIYPVNTQGEIDGDKDQRNIFLRDIQSAAASYLNFDNDPTKKSDPSQYFSKGISKDQLDSYSYYNNQASFIVNPYIAILKEFPQLNQYYDLYQNMIQDLNYFKMIAWKKDDTTPQYQNILYNGLNSYVHNMGDMFNNKNGYFTNIFINHDATDFENQFQLFERMIFTLDNADNPQSALSYLASFDLMMHIEDYNIYDCTTLNSFNMNSYDVINADNFNFTKNNFINMFFGNSNKFLSSAFYISHSYNGFYISGTGFYDRHFLFTSTPDYGFSSDIYFSEGGITKINGKNGPKFIINKITSANADGASDTNNYHINITINFDSSFNSDKIFFHKLY